MDEIEITNPEVKRLTIVVTSRTFRGATQAVKNLFAYSSKKQRNLSIEFDYLLLDQTDMVSVVAAARELKRRFSHVDYIFFNSSHSQMGGIDYWQATKDFFQSPIHAFTVGTFKIQGEARKSADGMGAAFQANVFAPWYLVREIKAKLLHRGSRLIWISTSISLPEYFNADDLGVENTMHSYEASKYELEILHQATYKRLLAEHGIQSWLLQPGVFKSTTFVPTMNFFMYAAMLLMFYICRWSGSPYHCIYPELASNAPIWCALYADPAKNPLEIKYGSSSTRLGKEKLIESKVDTTAERNELVLQHVETLAREWSKKLEDQIVERVGY